MVKSADACWGGPGGSRARSAALGSGLGTTGSVMAAEPRTEAPGKGDVLPACRGQQLDGTAAP